MKTRLKSNAKGFGLVEIMMGLIIVIVLVIGFASVMMNRSTGYQVDYNLTQLQRRGNFTQIFLSQSLRLPDHNINAAIANDEPYQNYPNLFPTNAKVITGVSNAINGSDAITIAYQASKDNMLDCMTVNSSPNHPITSMLFITENSELACCAVVNGAPNFSNRDVLIEGVEAMRIRYGEATNNTGMINRYVAADNPDLSFSRVLNVKISLLIRTPEKASLELDSKYYTLQDVELGPFNDHYLRKVYTTTIAVSGLPATQKGL